MNSTSKLLICCILSTAFVLGLTGCQKSQPIDPTQYNAADWEKRMRDPSLTEEEFTQLYAQAAAAQMKGCTVRITGKREVTIKFDDGSELKALVNNAWADATHDPEHRVEICRRYLSTLMTSKISLGDEPAPLNASNIVAVVRDDSFLKQLEKLAGTTTNRLVCERLAADLNVVYASDRQGAIAYVMENDRNRLGLDLAGMRGLALTNLQRILPELKIHGPGPLFMVEADGNYESSLLLADGFWSDQASVVKGDIVVAVPSRAVLVFAGSASPEGMRQLRELTGKVYETGDHVISKTLLVRRNGHWEKFSE